MLNQSIMKLMAFICIDILVAMMGCQGKQAQYRKIVKSGRICTYRMKSTPMINSSLVKDSELYLLSDKEGLIRIDPKTGSEEVLFGVGQGPNSLLSPSRLSFQNGEILACSAFSLDYVYHFDFQNGRDRINRLKLPFSWALDDVVALGNRQIACSSVYWDDGLVRVISNNGTLTATFGKPHHIDLMQKFNINDSAMYISGKRILAIQGIVPEIQVIDISKKKVNEFTISLSPPFYRPFPSNYDVPKYAFKKHKKWMARWTRLADIMGTGKWVLVKYRKGYEHTFFYELLNLEDLERRYYWGPTDSDVCRVRLKKNTVVVDGTCEEKEATEWVEDTYSLPL